MVSGLTAKQKKFCEEYIKTGKAGESLSLFKSLKIQAYLNELNDKVISDDVADIQECLKLVTDVMRSSSSTTAEKLKACDMRLKTLGAYIEKIQASVDTEICVNVVED